MRQTRGAQRLFSHSYSAGSQRRRSSADYWTDDYIAELRLDSLTVPAIVVPDTHLFDGRFFANQSPQKLQELLDPGAQSLPIVIAARQTAHGGSRIESALRESFIAEDGRLRSWTRNLIRDSSAAATLSETMASATVGDLDAQIASATSVGRGVENFLAALLGAASGDEAPVREARLGEHWDAWIQAEKDGAVRTQPYRPADFPLVQQAAEGTLDNASIMTPLGQQLHRQVMSIIEGGGTAKGPVDRVVAAAREDASAAAELLDVRTLESWYSVLRARALAAQHKCWGARGVTHVGDDGSLRGFDDDALRGSLPQSSLVVLPEEFLSDVAAADTETWAAVMQKTRQSRREWQADVSEGDSLRRTAATLLAEVSGLSPPDETRRRRYARLLTPPSAAGGVAFSTTGSPLAAVGAAAASATIAFITDPLKTSDRAYVEMNDSIVEFIGYQAR